MNELFGTESQYAHGKETNKSDGTKLPQKEPKDKFVAKMHPGFLGRRFLGSTVGFVVYLAVKEGYWIAINPTSVVEFSPTGLGFLSFLTGLFAKTFLEKLKGVFDNIFRASSCDIPFGSLAWKT